YRNVGPVAAYPRGRGFQKLYRERYGWEPPLFAANTHDAVVIGLRGVRQGVKERGPAGSLDLTDAIPPIQTRGGHWGLRVRRPGGSAEPDLHGLRVQGGARLCARPMRERGLPMSRGCTSACCRKMAVRQRGANDVVTD